MADQDSKMVLRTVYLPPELDDQLRVRAFRLKKTKNDLIRQAVEGWLLGASDGLSATSPKTKARQSPRSKSRNPATA